WRRDAAVAYLKIELLPILRLNCLVEPSPGRKVDCVYKPGQPMSSPESQPTEPAQLFPSTSPPCARCSPPESGGRQRFLSERQSGHWEPGASPRRVTD